MDTGEIPGRKSPGETSNFLSLLFFGWTAPIFWTGAKRGLKITDLYGPLKSDESERLGDRLEREWKKELINAKGEFTPEKKPTRQPNLKWAIARMFWAPYMMHGMLLLIQSAVLHVMQPVLQGWVIGYFNPGENLMTRNQALLNAGFLVITNLSLVFITHHTILQTKRIGMCVRVACCSMIYRKVLRLDQAAVNSTAAGRVANLISNDVARFDMLFANLHYIWIMPIQLSLIGYVVWKSVGVASLAGIGTVMIQAILIQGCLSRLNAKFRSKIAPKTDERVQLMSELISGIQVVKMYSWEKPFELIVSKARALEIKVIGYTLYLKGFCRSIGIFSSLVTLYLTLITFVLMGNSLTAEIVFVLASLFNVLQMTCFFAFPQALISAGEAAVSLKRLTEFLLMDEVTSSEAVEPIKKHKPQKADSLITIPQIDHGVGIEMVKVSATWVHGRLPPTLDDVSMIVKNQSLCAIVGPVGSGKSALLNLLLGELPLVSGRLSLFTGANCETKIESLDTRISYTSQDPWIFSGSIRGNILSGQPYDEKRYKEVTRVCALLEDFKQLPHGDMTFVGERGAALSGGQKARVNLARAVYRDADVYLFDDPLSAVDPRVGRHLFEVCIAEFLKGKTRILVTHQLQYLQQTDHVVVMNRGSVEVQGTYEEAAISIFRILRSENTREVENTEETYEKMGCKTSDVLANDNDQPQEVNEGTEGLRDINKEEIATGNISKKVYWSYISASGNLCSLTLLVAAFIAVQITASSTDYWVTYWTNQDTLRVASQINKSAANNMSYCNKTESNRQGMCLTEWQWFDENGLLRPNSGIYIYTICIIGCFLLMLLQCMLFMRMCLNASRNIHKSMFANLLHAPMRSFNTNPAGRILNRFSKDVGVMDEQLPEATLDALQIMLMMIAITTVVILVNYVMILPAVIIVAILYVVSTYYLKTAQDVMRLEGIAKSPVFSHVSSTLDGLPTIRSRGALAIELLKRGFDRHQDAHTGAWYLSLGTAAALGLLVDLILCSFTACICFSFILMDDGTTLPGFVGLAIFQSLTLTGEIAFGVRQCVRAISHMSSVERLIQYTNLPKEGSLTSKNPPPCTWPPNGALVFKDVTMRYDDNKPPILKSLNLIIHSGWKVGIVGRTGAGKSSLISALFRLTGDGLEGEIILDGIDTKSIGLHELRPHISIIPQEPILFSASLRYNLDPFEEYSDAKLWDSLREVELADVLPSLDFQVDGGGANFSVGQRQLICLARAILRNNRLLVLDEATANVDHGTDALIQNTIRRRFADRTVLTIAHRLNTIMDSDRVLVIKDGCVVEFDHPHLLLKNREGNFFQMVQNTGKVMAEKLAEIAKSTYLLSPEFRKE